MVSIPSNTFLIFHTGQRIVARVRKLMLLTLLQEVEFVEGQEGDAPSRLRIKSSIVGERRVRYLFFTQNLSDGFRAVVMCFSGRTRISSKSVGGIC